MIYAAGTGQVPITLEAENKTFQEQILYQVQRTGPIAGKKQTSRNLPNKHKSKTEYVAYALPSI